ncbi:acyl carrier protein [Xenorhabdus bovienii]|uniref:Acyl carrier protein n=1 Tax=Xenorhabdus bovienii str. Intermedium TaxID=1379677 RepID=A0A077QNI7_XENBV|nr:acyl carrier protein [Xenorhabdus bovienii]MDE9482252.1 acyl carrier protein [Xenorhabdus bovienii]MDE9544393.1 acyl carrier protein [Xenorhabdus bovienii]CDH33821.1 Acyl carrier protein [Xenorhabdus bovienii str. Intermedium]
MREYVSAVREELSSILFVEENTISENSSLINELGADSLDVIDLSFNLGKKFKVKMPTKSVFAHAYEVLPEEVLSRLLTGDTLTQEGKGLLVYSCYNYTLEQLKDINTLGDVFGETNVHNWASLCKVICESNGISADEIILKEIEKYCSEVLDK